MNLFGDKSIRPKVNATTVRLGTGMGGKQNSKNATQISSKKNSNITKQQDNKRAKLKNRKQLCNMEIQKRHSKTCQE